MTDIVVLNKHKQTHGQQLTYQHFLYYAFAMKINTVTCKILNYYLFLNYYRFEKNRIGRRWICTRVFTRWQDYLLITWENGACVLCPGYHIPVRNCCCFHLLSESQASFRKRASPYVSLFLHWKQERVFLKREFKFWSQWQQTSTYRQPILRPSLIFE